MTVHTPAAWGAAAAEPPDAIAMLKADHQAVRLLFADYDATESAPRKRALVAEICAALTVHGQIEDEIFYPEVKTAVKDKSLIPQATVDHRAVKDLIALLQGARPDGNPDDATVQLLAAYVQHHIRAADDGLFPQAEASSLDMNEIGNRMAARKDDLLLKST